MVPTLAGGRGWGIPTLADGWGTYLGWGVPTLAGGQESTYLGRGGVPTLAGGWGVLQVRHPPPQQLATWLAASCVHAGGLSCVFRNLILQVPGCLPIKSHRAWTHTVSLDRVKIEIIQQFLLRPVYTKR